MMKPLHAYGVVFFLAVELRNYCVKELSADEAIFDLTGAAKITTVGGTVARSFYSGV